MPRGIAKDGTRALYDARADFAESVDDGPRILRFITAALYAAARNYRMKSPAEQIPEALMEDVARITERTAQILEGSPITTAERKKKWAKAAVTASRVTEKRRSGFVLIAQKQKKRNVSTLSPADQRLKEHLAQTLGTSPARPPEPVLIDSHGFTPGVLLRNDLSNLGMSEEVPDADPPA